jgi:hypothetical protein
MELPKKKRECYTHEDPEEEVVVEAFEVETSVTPIEDDYEPVHELPFPVRKAQLEHLSKVQKEEEDKDTDNIHVKPQDKKMKKKPIETMEKELTSFVKGSVKAADMGKLVVP